MAESSTLRQRVQTFIRSCGQAGCTDREAEMALGVAHSSLVPRRSELVKRGLVVDTGRKERRPGASRKSKVWRWDGDGKVARPGALAFDSSGYEGGRAPSVAQETSHDAADAIEEKAPSLRVQVFEYVSGRGPIGATDNEIENALDLRHQTASARRRELVIKEMVFDSGFRRKTDSGRGAMVWVAQRSWIGNP